MHHLSLPRSLLRLPIISNKGRIFLFYAAATNAEAATAGAEAICRAIGMLRADGTPDVSNFRSCRSMLVSEGLLGRTRIETLRGVVTGFAPHWPASPDDDLLDQLLGVAPARRAHRAEPLPPRAPRVYLFIDADARDELGAGASWVYLNNLFRSPAARPLVAFDDAATRDLWRRTPTLGGARPEDGDLGLQITLLAIAGRAGVTIEGDARLWLERQLRAPPAIAPIPAAIVAADIRLLRSLGYLSVAEFLDGA